MSFKITDI